MYRRNTCLGMVGCRLTYELFPASVHRPTWPSSMWPGCMACDETRPGGLSRPATSRILASRSTSSPPASWNQCFYESLWIVGHFSARSCTCTLFLPTGVEIELIFALRAAISEIQADFQNCHIWAWNLAIGQSAGSCTYTLSLPRGCVGGGQNWAYLSSTESGFRDMGQLSKLPYLGMKLAP